MALFTVRPATLPDLPAIAAISLDAFISNPATMSYWMLKNADENALLSWRLKNIEYDYRNRADLRHYKLVDIRNEKIVAFALWQVPVPLEGDKEEAEKKRMEDEHKKQNPAPEGTDETMLQDFDREIARARAIYVNKATDYVLKVIATLPEYQGKGCASALLNHGLAQVDAADARAWLEATPQGRPIYINYGWRDVDKIAVDLSKYGGEGVQITTCMERVARSTAAQPSV